MLEKGSTSGWRSIPMLSLMKRRRAWMRSHAREAEILIEDDTGGKGSRLCDSDAFVADHERGLDVGAHDEHSLLESRVNPVR